MAPLPFDESPTIATEPKKIVVFYSSIGNGHISAARAIRRALLLHRPGAHVVLKDIRAFMNPLWRELDERLYWFIAENLPQCFDALFLSFQRRGSRVSSLSMLPNDYPEERLCEYLHAEAPDAILATHYGAAQVLGTLRERGLLPSTRIGWLHTDFFEGYFPRISKRIDRTFLAHTDLEARWIAAGVPADKVATTGMPVDVPVTDRDILRRSLGDLGLSPDITTVLITTGREGIGDTPTAIRSILRAHQAPIQIVVICGTNVARRAQIDAYAQRLPARATVKALGLAPHDQMVALMGAADLLITKAGGLTPSEAFALGTPTVLLDVVGGHERENAAMFTRSGMAVLASDPASVGDIAHSLLKSPADIAAMVEAQGAFRRNIRIEEIVRFVLDDRFAPASLPTDFGTENGTPVAGVHRALTRLDAEAPADVEVLLSYSTARSPQRIVLENPFGHIAVRIGETVYSANYIADPNTDPNFLQHLGLSDYLYGTVRPSTSQIHTNTYGMAYGRETLGLRVEGVGAPRLEKMRIAAHRIEEDFRSGKLRWDRSRFNCADVVALILAEGVSHDQTWGTRLGLPTMPLDVFEACRNVFCADPELRVDLVAYRQVPGAKASYRFSRFPLSVGQPLRSIANALRDHGGDALEGKVNHQIGSVQGDRRLLVDVLRAPGPDSIRPGETGEDETRIERVFLADLLHLIARRMSAPFHVMNDHAPTRFGKEVRELADDARKLLQHAVEQTESFGSPDAQRLRELCDTILSAHFRSTAAEVRSALTQRPMERLRAYEGEISRKLDSLATARTRRARVWSRALWRRLTGVVRSVGEFTNSG